jgi:hypothetical protein
MRAAGVAAASAHMTWNPWLLPSRRNAVPDPYALLSLFSTHLPHPLEDCRPDWEFRRHRVPTRVFVLGINERRVTLYSQQCRALNLVWLLRETGVLQTDSGQRVAVVGAGAGGLTAAAAAASIGHDVVLLNDHLEPMPLQRFARHRWLHPHLFEWPADGWWKERAGLPLLDWTASYAHEVREQIVDRFNACRWRGQGEVRYAAPVRGVEIVPADERSGLAAVRWSLPRGAHSEERVSAVVLAVGFGSERSGGFSRPPLYEDSYWDDPGSRWSSPGRVLISGGGDGGLTEVLHAALGERFDHRQIVELAGKRAGPMRVLRPEETWVRRSRKQIGRFEQEWRHRRRPPAEAARSTMAFFSNLRADACDDALRQARISGERSAAREVTLLVAGDDLDPKSCALNRFLLARLKHRVLAAEPPPRAGPAFRLDVVHGRFDHKALRSAGRAYQLTVAELAGGRKGAASDPIEADVVVIRHGTRPPRPLDAFTNAARPDVDSRVFSGRTAAILDTTRRPAWPDGFYPPCMRASLHHPRLRPDPPVFGERTHAARTSSSVNVAVLQEPSLVLLGGLEAAAMAGLALFGAGIEKLLRSSDEVVTEAFAELLDKDQRSVAVNVGLTVDDERFARRRGELLDATADAAAWGESRDGVDTMLALGHLRAGTVAAGVAVDDTGPSPEIAAAVHELLEDAGLPWWTAYGYAAARHDHAPTQLAFARQLMRRAARHPHAPDAVWDAAYTAIRRAIRALPESGGRLDRRVLAAALVEAAELVQRMVGEEAMRDYGSGFARQWDVQMDELPALAVLFGLEAVDPMSRAWTPLRWVTRRRAGVPPGPFRPDRLLRLAELAGPEGAGDVLRRAASHESPRISPLDVDRAKRAVAERAPTAAHHVDWVLRHG